MAPVVWNAGRVLTEIDHRRLGLCPSCDWLFHDTTRNRSRRWCDMGDCGSRDKSLRYYHRRKLAEPDETRPDDASQKPSTRRTTPGGERLTNRRGTPSLRE
jgi:hypothetical protein